MKRPRIYGSEANCRRALARYISSADTTIDESMGLRKRVIAEDLLAEFIILGWDSPRRWQANTRSGLSKYLQDQLGKVLPVLCAEIPRRERRVLAPGEQPRLKREQDEVLGELDGYVDWVTAARDELKELQAAVGVRRGIVPTLTTVGRFEELLASGLVDRQVIEDHARDMRAPKTPKQLAGAIGAAKDLTEATLRAAIDHAGESWKPREDLGVLMRTWRQAMLKKAAPDPEGEEALSRVQAGLGSLITFLAEWRNRYGDGHGRTRYPPGLRDRHARLAVDAAETAIRFIVTTMDDLQMLPPSLTREVRRTELRNAASIPGPSGQTIASDCAGVIAMATFRSPEPVWEPGGRHARRRVSLHRQMIGTTCLGVGPAPGEDRVC